VEKKEESPGEAGGEVISTSSILLFIVAAAGFGWIYSKQGSRFVLQIGQMFISAPRLRHVIQEVRLRYFPVSEPLPLVFRAFLHHDLPHGLHLPLLRSPIHSVGSLVTFTFSLYW
jgi:hypothetical protein